jgi:hypothetical protein
MAEKYARTARALVGAALILQATACGTILHPERRGQRGGRIDAGIAVLDAVGLLFFIIPGVIAFAVDFTNGTIYLPGGGKGGLGRNEPLRIRFDPRADPQGTVERIVRERTGATVRLDRDARVRELNSADELPALFANGVPAA